MLVKSIQPSLNVRKNLAEQNNQAGKKRGNNPSFQGDNLIVSVMDVIARGGFMAGFIGQDFIGMVAPRIGEGLNRNRRNPETGKNEGPLNWEFARKEGLREILSGPSAFLIPAAMLQGIKYTGTANNVHIDYINGYSKVLAEYAANNTDKIKDIEQAKTVRKEYYEKIFKNVFDTSLEGKMPAEDLEKTAKEYANKLIQIEEAPKKNYLKVLSGKQVDGSKQDLINSLVEDFADIKKKYLSSSMGEMTADLTVEGKEKPLSGSFKKMLDTITDYSDDALKSVRKKLANNSTEAIEDIVNNFKTKRVGTRFLSNAGMWGAVMAFYTIIPKLYNMGAKGAHLKGLIDEPEQTGSEIKTDGANKKASSQVPFSGKEKTIEKLGKNLLNDKWLKKISDKFEFNGASMSPEAMLALLYGFCLPPRIIGAQDKHDRKEIIFRDMLSFFAILFGAKALSRGFSDGLSKFSGLALNTKTDEVKNGSFFKKAFYYFSPKDQINVLNSGEITSMYSDIHKLGELSGERKGILGFLDKIKNNGGDIKKTLMLDKTVKENTEELFKQAGRRFSDTTSKDMEVFEEVFKRGANSKEMENIYNVFKNKGNKYIKSAKLMNSSFGFVSMLVLVPAFMVWLAKYCEKMTKRNIAKEKELKNISQSENQPQTQNMPIHSNKISMAGFLGK